MADAPATPPAPAANGKTDIVFVHGVEWERDAQLKGYSEPLQDQLIMRGGDAFNFHEVLWADSVKDVELAIIQGAKVIQDLLTGNVFSLILDLFDYYAKRQNVDPGWFSTIAKQGVPQSKAAGVSIPDAILYVLLDLILYFTGEYGAKIRNVVRQTLSPLDQPIVFGHSLGSVIVLDIVRENLHLKPGKPGIARLVSAASPIGLFYPNRDDSGFKTMLWRNYYSTNDLVTPWNPLNHYGYTSAQDYLIKTDSIPFYSHIRYWMNETVAGALL